MNTPHLSEVVPAALAGERLDRFVCILTDCSRSEATDIIRAGGVRVGTVEVVKGSHRLGEGDLVAIGRDPRRVEELPEPDPSVPFDVVRADEDVIVVDKPAGVVVHPAPGHLDGTLVNGLLSRFPEIAGVGEQNRPGIVHRLDRQTSGLLVVARTPLAYDSLVAQMVDHSAGRTYSALVLGHPSNEHGVIDAPIGRSHRDPTRMTVAMDGRPARTHFRVDSRFEEPLRTALLTCDLETGRTHQIRVHLASIGHPVAGDGTYGGSRPGLAAPRPFLHARRLSFRHPRSGEAISEESPLAHDLRELLDELS